MSRHAMALGLLVSAGSTGCEADVALDEPPWPPSPPAPVDRAADLVVDADRDGTVDPQSDADQSHGGEWNVRWGATLLANLDDDDQDGTRDAETPEIDGQSLSSGDALDLARVLIPPWPEVAADVTATLRVSPEAGPYVRVHRLLPGGTSALVLGVDGPCSRAELAACPWTERWEVPNDVLRSGAELGVEALWLAGEWQAPGWDGTVELSLGARDGAGLPIRATQGAADGVDRVVLRVAPWIMQAGWMEIDRVYASTVSEPFLEGLDDALAEAEIPLRPIPWEGEGGWPDHWTQDWFQPGYAAMPGPAGTVRGMRIALARPFSYGGPPIEWLESEHLGPDTTCIAPYREPNSGGGYDSFGNHELVPPYEHDGASYPIGRILVGVASALLPETTELYAGQRVQGPLLDLDTSWLDVGHVDEVVSFVPSATARGWKLLVASPLAAFDLLEGWQAEGHGAESLLEGRMGTNGQSAARSIDSLLADPDLAAWNQQAHVRMGEVIDRLVGEIGLDEDEIVDVPVLFESDDGLVAFVPNAINSLVVGDLFVAADPVGPAIDGTDGWQADLLGRLASPTHALGAEGTGLDVRFVDDWAWYHQLGGEVHCGTNAEGPPATMPWWTVER